MYFFKLSSYNSQKKINPNLSPSNYIVGSMFPAMFPTVFVAGISESVATALITCVMSAYSVLTYGGGFLIGGGG